MQENLGNNKGNDRNIISTKQCSKCTKTKEITAFRSVPNGNDKDGRFPWCRECEREYKRTHVARRRRPATPSTIDLRISPEFTPNQMDRDQCRAMFDYEPVNGDLFWHGTRKRVFERINSQVARHGLEKPGVEIDGVFYQIHVLVWNWHWGRTDGAVMWKDGDRLNNRIQNLRDLPPVDLYRDPNKEARRHNKYAVTKGALAAPIRCPCCYQETWRPTLDAVAGMAELQPMEKRILGAIWAGAGEPVENERIFLAMYEDDPDGGPEPNKMYSALKVALSYMRGKLRGTGVTVTSNGYRRGYRLVLGE